MSRSFMLPVAPFTLDSLVTAAQWSAARSNNRRTAAAPVVPKPRTSAAKEPEAVREVRTVNKN